METINQLSVFDPLKAEVAKWAEVNESMTFDYEDPQGEKAARSHIFKLRGTKSKIAAVHKDAKAEALAHCRAVDGEKKFLIGKVEEMIEVHQHPIDVIAEHKRLDELAKLEAERAEKERLEKERLDAIAKQEAENARKTAELEARIAAAAKAEDELLAKARAAGDALMAKTMAEVNRLEAEEESRRARVKAEVDRLDAERAKFEAEKKAEQDARIREDEAKRRAEVAAAFEKKEAAEKAEREKALAIAKAEQKAADDIRAKKTEEARLAQIEADRVADEEHRKGVRSLVIVQLENVIQGIIASNKDVTESVVDAIIAGEIDHVTINY